jgi:hypothetical protein
MNAVRMPAALAPMRILLAQTGLLVLGAVFLAEELYETGVLALIIRSGARTESEGSRGLSARDYE